jgi:hypothetical protein
MIIEEYDLSLFTQRFENMNRVETLENPNGNFSYSGLRVLFDHIDETYDEEAPFKMDVIELCCSYSEYKNGTVYLNDYPTELKKDDYDEIEEFWEDVEEEINDKTTLIKLGDDLNEGFIIGTY